AAGRAGHPRRRRLRRPAGATPGRSSRAMLAVRCARRRESGSAVKPEPGAVVGPGHEHPELTGRRSGHGRVAGDGAAERLPTVPGPVEPLVPQVAVGAPHDNVETTAGPGRDTGIAGQAAAERLPSVPGTIEPRVPEGGVSALGEHVETAEGPRRDGGPGGKA